MGFDSSPTTSLLKPFFYRIVLKIPISFFVIVSEAVQYLYLSNASDSVDWSFKTQALLAPM